MVVNVNGEMVVGSDRHAGRHLMEEEKEEEEKVKQSPETQIWNNYEIRVLYN